MSAEPAYLRGVEEGLLQALVDAIDAIESKMQNVSSSRTNLDHSLLVLSSPQTVRLASQLASGTSAAIDSLAEPQETDKTNGKTEVMSNGCTHSSCLGPLAVPLGLCEDLIDDHAGSPLHTLLHPDRSRSRLSQWVLPLWAPLLGRWHVKKQDALIRLAQLRRAGRACGGDSPLPISHGQWRQMERLSSALSDALASDLIECSAAASSPVGSSTAAMKTQEGVAACADQRATEQMRQQLQARVQKRKQRERQRQGTTAQMLVLYGHLSSATHSFRTLCQGAITVLRHHVLCVLEEVREVVEDSFVTAVLARLDQIEAGEVEAETTTAEDATVAAALSALSLSLRTTVRVRVMTCAVEAWSGLLLYAHKYGDAKLYNDNEEEEAAAAERGEAHDPKSSEARAAVVHAALTTALNESIWLHVFVWMQRQLKRCEEDMATCSYGQRGSYVQRCVSSVRGLPFAEAVAIFLSGHGNTTQTSAAETRPAGFHAALVSEALCVFYGRLSAALRLHASARLFAASDRVNLRPALCLPLNLSVCQLQYARFLRARPQHASPSSAAKVPAAPSDQAELTHWKALSRLVNELVQAVPPNEEEAWSAALTRGNVWSTGNTSDAVTAMAARYNECMRQFWARSGGDVALRDAALGCWDDQGEAMCTTLSRLVGRLNKEERVVRRLARADGGLKRFRDDEAKMASDSDDEENDELALRPHEAEHPHAESLCLRAVTPAHVFWATEFFPVYHPTSFASLRRERQRKLTRQIAELHTRLVSKEVSGGLLAQVQTPTTRTSVPGATAVASGVIAVVPEDDDVWSTSSEEEDDKKDKDDAEKKKKSTAGSDAADEAAESKAHNDTSTAVAIKSSAPPLLWVIASDVRVVMWLVHTLLVLQERKDAIAAQDARVLHEDVVPLLVLLSSTAVPGAVDCEVSWSEQTASRPFHERAPAVEEAEFCLLAALNAELLTLPWRVEGVYLALQRYKSLCERVKCEAEARVAADARLAQCTPQQTQKAVIAAACARMADWLSHGGAPFQSRQPGSAVGAACDEADEEHLNLDPLYHQLASGEVKGAFLRAHLRRAASLHWPAPCGLVFVMSVCRTVHDQFCRFRHEWEAQQRRLQEDGTGYEYAGRDSFFCTQDDVIAFSVLVHTVHTMVFGFTPQPAWLLRLWLGQLAHLFTSFVPSASSELDAVALQPSGWCRRQEVRREVDLFGERKVWDGWRAATFKEDHVSPQTSLRIALGEALADLALLPLSDPQAVEQCSSAFPFEPWSSTAQVDQQAQRAQALAVQQRTLPHQVCELLCMFLEIGAKDVSPLRPMPASSEPPPAVSKAVPVTKRTVNHIGLHGLIAFCRRLEKNTLPDSSRDERLKYLLTRLWDFATECATGR